MTGITVTTNNMELPRRAFVIDMLMTVTLSSVSLYWLVRVTEVGDVTYGRTRCI